MIAVLLKLVHDRTTSSVRVQEIQSTITAELDLDSWFCEGGDRIAVAYSHPDEFKFAYHSCKISCSDQS